MTVCQRFETMLSMATIVHDKSTKNKTLVYNVLPASVQSNTRNPGKSCGRLKVSDLRSAEDSEGAELYRRLVSGEIGFFEREHQYHRKDGAQIWGHATVSAVRDGDHTMGRWLRWGVRAWLVLAPLIVAWLLVRWGGRVLPD